MSSCSHSKLILITLVVLLTVLESEQRLDAAPKSHEIINVNDHNLKVQLGESGNITFRISPPIRDSLDTHLILEPADQASVKLLHLKQTLKNVYDFPLVPDTDNNETIQEEIVKFVASNKDYGRVVVYLKPINYTIYDRIDSSRAFTWISVSRHPQLVTLDQVLRFINLIFWSLCLYPQIILNYQRKSSAGLTYDYVLLTWICGLTGFIKIFMYRFDKIQKQNLDQTPQSVLESDIAEIVFASHDFIIALILFTQTIFYKRNNAREGSSRFTKDFVDFFFYAGSYSIFAALVGYANWILYLNLVIDFQLGSRVLRNVVQAFKHYGVKSTVGFSVYVPMIEMIGSIVLPFRLLMSLLNYGTFNYTATIFVALIIFKLDMTLVTQHFCLYKGNVNNESENTDTETGDGDDSGSAPAQTPSSGGSQESIRAKINRFVASRRMPLINETAE